MNDFHKKGFHRSARKKFLELSLESTRKSYYPQLMKQLESAKKNEQQLQLLIDNMPAQISYVTAQEEFALVNREFETVIGLGRDQIVGSHLSKILGKKNYIRVKPHIESALSGKSGCFEIFIPDPKNKHYEINYVAETEESKKTNGFYVLAIDLTEKKKAEAEKSELKDRLRQAQKMEAIGTLSGGIAHDFNNILSGIFGYSQLIDFHVNDPEQIKNYNRKIVEGAERAASLVRQILTFSRKTEYNRQYVSFHSILKEALKLLRSTIPANIEIIEDIRSDATILADATQIHQVIMNLCTNAYHAMGNDSGILTLTLHEVLVTEKMSLKDTNYSPGRYLNFEIRDTGQGIDPQTREKIFDPYFTTKPMGKGTGLGLSIVRGIVERHGGAIELDTKVGEGTCFSLYFPVVTEETPDTETVENPEEKSAAVTGNIMVIDDEPAILNTLSAILSRQGYQISAFDNGVPALETFTHTPDRFDLIITDMTMPRLTGDRLARKILKIRADIPILVCTGYHESFSEAEATRAGITKFIQKPITASALLKIINELLPTRAPVVK